MAARQLVSKKPKPTRPIRSYRFAEQQHGHHLWYLSLSVSGNIAVSGWNDSNKTFIELYFSNSSSSRDESQSIYSNTFEKYSNYLYRYVSFLTSNGSELVTCIGDKIEVIDTKNESKVLRSCRVGGEARCLAVRNRKVFIGLMKSQTVIVFNNNLKEMKKVLLKGITDGDYPRDLQVMKDTVFVCTVYGRALSVGVYGDNVTEYTNTTAKYSDSNSITVSKELGLVAALWTDYPTNQIIFYTLKENKPFLAFDVDADISRIRISDTDRMMITGNRETGEIKKYDLGKLFTYDDLKELLVSGLQEEDCKKLVRLRMVNKAQLDTILKSRAPAKSLLRALEKEGVVQKFHVGRLRDALKGINPTYYNIVDIYQKTRHSAITSEDENQQLLKEKKAMQDTFFTNMDEQSSIRDSAEEYEILSRDLPGRQDLWEEAKRLFIQETEKLNADMEEIYNSLSKSTIGSAKAGVTDEHEHEESRAQKEVLNQTCQAMTDTQTVPAISSANDQSVQTILSSSYITCNHHVKRLTNEGYVEQEVINALDLSKNELDMARKVLQCIGNQRELLPKEGNLLYKEQYIDENGGEIILQEANIHMRIPVDALSKGEIVSITMMTSKHIELPSEPRTPQLTPIIKCGQGGITLNKPVTLRIPHCAAETEGITSTDMYLGFSNKGEEIQWRQRKKHEPGPILKKDHFEVLLQTFCTISLHVEVDNTKRLRKRFRVVPFINRIVNPSDDLIITLWIYNDDETEHMYLLQEEIEIGGKIQLHDFKIFTLKGFRNDKEVYIRSSNKQIYAYPERNIMKFTSTALWHNTSHRADFRFQNKEGISDITFKLRLYTKQFMRSSDDVQFDLKVTLSELLQRPRESTKALIQIQEPQPAMEKSFQELIKQLSGELNVNSCLKIARIFGLSSEIKKRIKQSSEPGNILLEDLVHEQLISAASVSAMDAALTKTGSGHLAEYVKEYRRRNAPFPTTVPVFS